MLRKETVSPLLLDILRRLFKSDHLKGFVLVGGTALSLRIGHRKSIDIDLFTNEKVDFTTLPDSLIEIGMKLEVSSKFAGGLFGFIEGVKSDFIRHAYPWISPFETFDGIPIASLNDIAAMKLNAIVGSGSRLKDFVDVAYLSSHMSLSQMLDFYEQKYPNINGAMALKSLCYFEDIDHSVEIDMLTASVEWPLIRGRILEMVAKPNSVFKKIS